MIRVVLTRTAIAALLVYGFFFDVRGARNVFYFVAWILAIGLYLDAINPKKPRDPKKPAVPVALTIAFDVAVIITLVWVGAWLAWIPWIVLSIAFHSEALPRSRQPA